MGGLKVDLTSKDHKVDLSAKDPMVDLSSKGLKEDLSVRDPMVDLSAKGHKVDLSAQDPMVDYKMIVPKDIMDSDTRWDKSGHYHTSLRLQHQNFSENLHPNC